jgi:hypothetical protein
VSWLGDRILDLIAEVRRLREENEALKKPWKTDKIGTAMLNECAMYNRVEAALDELLEDLGLLDLGKPSYKDNTYNPYDSSIEFKGAEPGFELTMDQWRKLNAVGFMKCWVCYEDGSEWFYSWNSETPSITRNPQPPKTEESEVKE